MLRTDQGRGFDRDGLSLARGTYHARCSSLTIGPEEEETRWKRRRRARAPKGSLTKSSSLLHSARGLPQAHDVTFAVLESSL
jgi:hypothetical protein